MLNEDLTSKIERYKIEMNGIAKYDTVIKQKKYTDLFDITKNDNDKGFSYKENYAKINKIRHYFGYFILFTNDEDATASSIIEIYKEKGTVEKLFYDMKQYINARRIRVHKKSTFDGKYFITFISLILRRWLVNKLYQYKTAKHLTLKRCIMKLNDVMIYYNSRSIHLLKAITAEQRDLLNICNVNEDKMVEDAEKYLANNPRMLYR